MSRPRLKSDHGTQYHTRAEGNGLEIEKKEKIMHDLYGLGPGILGKGFNSGKPNEDLRN